jgi:endonuclease/exonuclease/phosphatase (EEP) superfamily protein YafD
MHIVKQAALWGALGALWVGSLASFAGPLWWRFALLSHFRVHMLLTALVFALGFALTRWRVGWVGALLVGALHGAGIGSVLWSRPPLEAAPAEGAQTLKVLSVNVLGENPDTARLLALIEAEQPDVIAVQEVRAHAAAALAGLTAYPHRLIIPQPDNFGVGLLSRAPLTDLELHHWEGFISVSGYIQPSGPWVLVTHPPPPMSARQTETRDRVLEEVGAKARGMTSAVVAGDLNQTPWAVGFGGWLRDARLREARPRWSFTTTWPSGSLLWAGITIDHVLITDDWHLCGYEVGPDVGSDHRPVIVTLWRTAP